MSIEAADQAFRKGDFSSALQTCALVLGSEPNNAGALRIRGMSFVRLGRLDEAIASLQQASKMNPTDFLALEWLHGALTQKGRTADAILVGEQALSLRPNDVQTLLSLGQACSRIGQVNRGIQYLERARSVDPANALVRNVLGQSYEKAKLNRMALAEYEEAIRLNSALADAYDRLTRILLENGQFETAQKHCERAFQSLPNYGQARLQSAQALMNLNREEEAVANAKKAAELDPALAAHVATWFQAYGRNALADEVLQTSIKRQPVQGKAYYALVKSQKITSEDSELIRKLDELAKNPSLPPKERYALLRALGKAADDLGNCDNAMRRFDEAAHLGQKIFSAIRGFDPNRLDSAREAFLRIFDKGFLSKNKNLGLRGTSLIFVIGMIRSGTTLVQQILTSHPQIGDAGEQPFWTTEFPHLFDFRQGTLNSEGFMEARDRYVDILKRFDSEAPMVSNKWPMNYAHAGLLLLAYPDAKIIHTKRNPIDTALSIYMTDLGEPPPEFVYEKAHIVRVYRDYEARMMHWAAVLPPGSIFTVEYEDLVADQETWSRKLIEFCGLEWNDDCLNFFQGNRRVNTPSMLQVRQPIYKTSVEKWRRYEAVLGEFAELRSSL